MTNSAAARQEFEAVVLSKPGFKAFPMTLILPNIYENPFLQAAWEGWQAALSRHLLGYQKLLETVEWIASQQDLFFAECSQAEEIVERCKESLAVVRAERVQKGGE